MTRNDQEQAHRLGKYTIQGELGRGGFATVYMAHDTVLRRDVALKLLHPQLLTDPAFVTRFENDARATAQLDHSRIATIYELGHHEGRMFMAIQLMPGGSLADRIKAHGRLTFAEAVRVIEDVAQALDHAHAAGFVHRDVKPSNILFNARGDAILTDFGLVKAAESSVIARTTMGGLIGTPAYMAPEIWEGQSDGPGADIYALGCVLFEMLSGELLFNGATPPAVMRAHFQTHRYPERWPDDTPAAIEAVIERALARDPAARYPSAGALAADVRALAVPIADPLAKPYAALQTALAAHEWDQAAVLAQDLIARNPDYRDVRALADRATAGQRQAAQAGQIEQWHDTALAAERDGEPDAARAAARQWLELAPGNAEAQALIERLVSVAKAEATPLPPTLAGDREGATSPPTEAEPPATTSGHNTNATPRIWSPVAAVSAGWVAGCIASVSLAWALEGAQSTASVGTIVGWAVGWAGGGLIAGLGLRRAATAGAVWRILWLTVGWPICMTCALVLAALTYNTQPNTAIVVLALAGALAGGIAGAAIRRLGQGLTSGQISLLALSWAIGWLLAEAGLNDGSGGGPWHGVLYKLANGSSFHEVFWSYSQLNIVVLAVAGITGAVLGAGLLWLLARKAAPR